MNRPTRNATMLFVGEVASRLFGFLVSAMLARRLGLDGFGQVGFATSIMLYGTVVTKFGLPTIGVRQVARDHSRIRDLVGNIVALRLLLGLLAVGGMVGFALLIDKQASVKWLVVLFALGVIVQSLMIEWVFTGIERMEFVSAARILTSLVYFTMVALLVQGPRNILAVPVAFAAGTLAGVTLLLVIYAVAQGFPFPRLQRSIAAPLFKSAWPIGVSTVLTQLHVNLGIVLLALLRTDSEAGLYTAAHRLVFLALMLDRVFQAVFLPVMSRYAAAHPDKLSWLAGTAIRVVLTVGLPVSVGVALLASPVVDAVFGAQYAEATPVLQVLVWLLPLSLLTSLSGYVLLATARERRFARNNSIGVGLSAILIACGVMLWGALGAALGIIAGELLLLILMTLDMTRIAVPKIGIRLLAPVLSCLPMAVVVYLLRPVNWPLAAASGGITYVAVVLLLRGVGPEDFGLAVRQ